MLFVQDEQTQVCGLVVIENYDGFGLVHARHFDQKAAKLFTSLIQVPVLTLGHAAEYKCKDGSNKRWDIGGLKKFYWGKQEVKVI